MKKITIFTLLTLTCFMLELPAQIVSVGSGSYTTVHPGTDVAGRNDLPNVASPNVTGNAATRPVPSSDWWTPFLAADFGNYVYNYPMSLRAKSNGLVLSYTQPLSGPDQMKEPMSAVDPLIIGVDGLSASKAPVSDHDDWTVDVNWNSGGSDFTATVGMGMPFAYFTKSSSDVAAVTVNHGQATVNNEILIIENGYAGSQWAVYAPTGSSWTQVNNTYTSTLNGQNYWSAVMLPDGDAASLASQLQTFAYVFPVNTTAGYNYDRNTGVVRTTFSTVVDVKEGSGTTILQGILPHQWANWGAGSPAFESFEYFSVRGNVQTIASNEFYVDNTFYGVLPILPSTTRYSATYDPAALSAKIDAIQGTGLSDWTDSYNQGIDLYMLVQGTRIAEQLGDTEAINQMVATVKERLEDWLTAESSEVAFLYMYESNWNVLLGYPAGHYQDKFLNDRHFHWGYFITAATLIEQYNPGWAAEWGDMVNMLVRDAASPDRNDDMFPYLRNFSPFAGHSWAAGGIDGEPMGNNQESTSEAMNFATSLINWGEITGNTQLTDLGVYIYTTEQTAVDEYWFDMYDRNFDPSFNYAMASRVWGAGYDRYTFWTQNVAASYGIEIFPLHGGSMYLAHNESYVNEVWTEMNANTALPNNSPDPNLWYDTYWMYLSMIDPDQALSLYEAYTTRDLKFGHTDAHTYHWLHSMVGLGKVDATITASHPLATCFNDNGQKTYVAHNYSNAQITVNFSDGYSLVVPANSTATNKDATADVSITASETEVPTNGSVNLTATVSGTGATRVEFYDGVNLIATVNSAPYTATASNLDARIHTFYAKVYTGSNNNISNLASVIVGSQSAYGGTPHAVPGTIEGGHYDVYEGGLGQGVTYSDATPYNESDGFREPEYVDAGNGMGEGSVVGWITGGEWLEYTINVAQAGYHDVDIRYAAGNAGTAGPLFFCVNGVRISEDLSFNSTGSWESWQTATATNVNLPAGEIVLRVVFTGGGFNVGRMTFSYSGPAGTNPPVADAGADQTITLPSGLSLDASASYDPDGDVISYLWEKISGPSCTISSATQAVTAVTGLSAGSYQFRVTVNDGSDTDTDVVNVTVNPEPAHAPVAVAGDDFSSNIPTHGNCVNLDGTTSYDLNGDALTYSWSQVSGPNSSNITVTGAGTASACDLIAGTYTFRLSVDDGGLSNTDDIVVTVTNIQNQAPVADAGADLDASEGCVNITGTATDPEGSIASTVWTQVSGPNTATLNNSSTLTVSACNLVEGTYVFRLTVTDGPGLTHSDDVQVTVTADPVCTGASGNGDYTYEVTSDGKIKFVPARTGVGNNIVILYLNGGGHIVQPNAEYDSGIGSGTITFYYTYSLPEGGENNTAATPHSVDLGSCGSSSTPVNTAPVASAGADVQVQSPADFATLNGAGTDADGDALTYTWTKISGGSATIVNPNSAVTGVSGLSVGGYVFRLTVDDGQATHTDDVTVSVMAAAPGKSIPGLIEAEDWDGMNGVQTESTSDAGGGLNVGWIDNGDWLEYNVDVLQSGNYDVNIRVAGDGSGAKSVQLLSDGSVLTNINFNGTGGWQNWTTVTGTVNLTSGSQTLRVLAASSGFNINYIEFNTAASSIPVTGVNISNGTVELEPAASFTLSATVVPANATDQTVSWLSNNTAVATVNSSGVVTAVADGSAVITVSTNDGNFTATSNVTVSSGSSSPGGDCTVEAVTGDYRAVVSNDANNPTITFEPLRSGVGNNIVILYYGFNPAGGYPGTIVTPNTPFTIGASAGQTVYFYYTYSVPEGGESNTFNNKHDFLVSDCSTLKFDEPVQEAAAQEEVVHTLNSDWTIYPNPTNQGYFTIDLAGITKNSTMLIEIFSLQGQKLYSRDNAASNRIHVFTDGIFDSGVYLVTLQTDKKLYTKRLIIE